MRLSAAERRALSRVMPRTRAQLAGWVGGVLGVEVSGRAGVCGPLDYLCHAFFEEGSARDCVVWANRGGGKTFYAALATALDLVFKPGIEVMILGGSLDQSRRMLSHLRALLGCGALSGRVARSTARVIELDNGSRVEVLAQSQTSVRGTRPQKIRCDEVDLFDREVWRAVQMVTRERVCGGIRVRGSVEALGTWHDPHGLLGELVEGCGGGEVDGRRLFRWGVVDVLERCAPEGEGGRSCEGCVLRPECGGRAREGDGHVLVEDAIQQKFRSDAAGWRSEMLCERPVRRLAVYPEFDVSEHVSSFEVGTDDGEWVGGIDFGFANPTVVLWGVLGGDGVLRIVDERVVREATVGEHVEAILGGSWPVPRWLGVDPAGLQRSDQTGLSAVSVLRRAGLMVRSRRVRLRDGVGAVRARLAPASGGRRLVVHERCERLIDSLRRYRFGEGGEEPVKDGPDHACDALRYLVVNLDSRHRASLGWYV